MELIIFFIFIALLGVAMLWVARWSRKKSAEFKSSDSAKICDSELKNKPILEQLRSKETWKKTLELFHGHDSNTDKGKAIQYDMVGYFGWVPLLIGFLILFALLALPMILF